MIQFVHYGLVEGTIDFVKQKDVATVKLSAGDAQDLSFAEFAASSFTMFRVDTIGHVKDKISTSSM